MIARRLMELGWIARRQRRGHVRFRELEGNGLVVTRVHGQHGHTRGEAAHRVGERVFLRVLGLGAAHEVRRGVVAQLEAVGGGEIQDPGLTHDAGERHRGLLASGAGGLRRTARCPHGEVAACRVSQSRDPGCVQALAG